MTQEVITDIKQREKEKDNFPICYMSAIAQHCIDNNPDITWRKIIDALLDAKEVTAAHYILDINDSSKEMYRLVLIIISFYAFRYKCLCEYLPNSEASPKTSLCKVNGKHRNLPSENSQ